MQRSMDQHAPASQQNDAHDLEVFAEGTPLAGLRPRVFLFFAAIVAGGIAAILLGGVVGINRIDPDAPGSAFVASMAIAGFLLLGLVAGCWLLFDEYIARPITALSAALRASAHAGVALKIDAKTTRYLGDLAPAANAVALNLARARAGVENAVSVQTARLLAESELLGEALRDAPIGLIVCSAEDKIVLYNREADGLLGDPERIGVDRPLLEAIEAPDLRKRLEEMRRVGMKSGACGVASLNGRSLDARLRMLDLEGADTRGAYALALFDPEARQEQEARGLDPADAYHDLSLIEAPTPGPTPDAPLNRLTYVVLDTETTGLNPEQGDEIVQIAAARIVNGRLLLRETFETLVDPERSIPAKSIEFHGITEPMVQGAPKIDDAGARLRRFAEDSVIVAHNTPFDLAFFHKHAERIGARFDMPALDTVLLSSVLFGQSAAHSLDDLAERFEIDIPEKDRHTARGDAEATAKILLRMIPVLEERGIRTLGDALEASEAQRMLTAKQRSERGGSTGNE